MTLIFNLILQILNGSKEKYAKSIRLDAIQELYIFFPLRLANIHGMIVEPNYCSNSKSMLDAIRIAFIRRIYFDIC